MPKKRDPEKEKQYRRNYLRRKYLLDFTIEKGAARKRMKEGEKNAVSV